MVDLLRISPRLDRDAHLCRAIVETPQNSRHKFDYHRPTGLFEVAAVLPAGLAFPLSFGFVPGTLGGDGDPLDVLILADEPLPVGALVWVRLLGVLESEQTEDGKTVRNDRLIAKVDESHSWSDVTEIGQLGDGFTKNLGRFFETYNGLRGRKFEIIGCRGPDMATALIERGKADSTDH